MKKGFTLIELLVVIAIIAILAVVVILNVVNARGRAGDSAALADMQGTQKIAGLCVAEGGSLMYKRNPTSSSEILPSTSTMLTNSRGSQICSLDSVTGNWPYLGQKTTKGSTYSWSLRLASWDSNTTFNIFAGTLDSTTGYFAKNDYGILCTGNGCRKQILSGSTWQDNSSAW